MKNNSVNNNNYSFWESYRGKIRSKKGGWKIAKKVESHGYDLVNELIGKYSYMQIIVLNATGRLPSIELSKWLEAVHISMSWPDPRIWCNRVAALGGSSNADIVNSTCAAVLAADSYMYGSLPFLESVAFIQEAKRDIDSGISVDKFVFDKIEDEGKESLKGYSRPIVKGDERISVLKKLTEDLGFKSLDHLNLSNKIEKVLINKYDEYMHLSGFIAAFMSDQGFSPREVYHIFTILPFSGAVACYVDANERVSGTFAPLQVEDIDYIGCAAREVPN